MTLRPARDDADEIESLPAVPLSTAQWQAICKALELSPQQCKVVELLLRGANQRQIASALNISEPTLKTYLQRIFARTSTRNRMHLAMRVLALSHQVGNDDCHP
jgi:DNA-binding NarL/FixJ family response regulator